MSYDQTGNDVNGQPPVLRYMDRTPLMKASASKRGCSELSPLEERSMEEVIQSALAAQMPSIIAGIQAEVRNSVSAAINDAIAKLKDEFAQKLTVQEERCNLKSLSEAELLESYNRRDNIKIIGLPEVIKDDGKPEAHAETIEEVVKLANKIEVNVDEQDISIAHRLPSSQRGKRPIIVRFNRRVSKIEMLKKKKSLENLDGYANVKVLEDSSRPRLAFFNLMKRDNRIAMVWTRESNIFFQYKNERSIQKTTGLYEGGDELGYQLQDV